MKNKVFLILGILALLTRCASAQQVDDRGVPAPSGSTLDLLLHGARSEVQRWDIGTENERDVKVYSFNPEITLDALMQAVKEAGFYQTYSGDYTRDWDLQRGVLRWCVFPDTERWDNEIQISSVGERTVYTYSFRPLPIMDGVPWRAVDSKISNDVDRIAFGNGIFVVTGSWNYTAEASLPGKMAYSRYGISWIAVEDSRLGRLIHPNIIGYGAGKFIVTSWDWDTMSARREMAYSTDGLTWTQIPDSLITDFRGSSHPIAYVGDRFFALGGPTGTRRAFSLDGLTWTEINDRAIRELEVNSITYGGGMYVAVGRRLENGRWKGAIAYSPDGISWTHVADNNLPVFSSWTTSIGSVVYGGDKFIALNNWGGHMVYSTDGVTWTFVQDENNSSGRNIGIFDEDKSEGGVIGYGGGRFVVFVSGKMAYSFDGVKWTVVEGSLPSSGLYDRVISITYGNNIFIIGGSKGKMWYWKQE